MAGEVYLGFIESVGRLFSSMAQPIRGEKQYDREPLTLSSNRLMEAETHKVISTPTPVNERDSRHPLPLHWPHTRLRRGVDLLPDFGLQNGVGSFFVDN
jgi:hypothetical protein